MLKVSPWYSDTWAGRQLAGWNHAFDAGEAPLLWWPHNVGGWEE